MKKCSRLPPILLALLLMVSIFPAPQVEALAYGMDTPLSSTDVSYYGEYASNYLGFHVADAGDVNGDGYGDYLISSHVFKADANQNVGKVYLFLGKEIGSGEVVNVTLSDASFIGEASQDRAGSSIDGAGDVNGDGYDDIIIGAHLADGTGGLTNVGKSYIIFGRASGWENNMSLSNANASYVGESTGDLAGYSVAGAGDVNGDGYDDILIGAISNDEEATNGGQVYLIFGSDKGWETGRSLDKADASFLGEANGDYAGSAVSGAGDVNGDGYDDILIGAPNNNEAGMDAGQTYLIYGGVAGWKMDAYLKQSNASFLGHRNDYESGSCVDGGGDYNNDGYDDIIIGAPGAEFLNSETGAVYMVLGQASDFERDLNLTTRADLILRGEGDGDNLGLKGSCHWAGDVNGDLYDDLVIGAKDNDEPTFGNDAGQSYLVLGAHDVGTKSENVDLADSSFWGMTSNDNSGRGVAGGGDYNGDGYDDILVGSPYENYQGIINRGRTYLIFPDSNDPPSFISEIKLFTSANYLTELDHASIGDMVYIELTSTDGLNLQIDTAVVRVSTSRGNPVGIYVKLIETGINTNVFHGSVKVANRTREDHDWIKAVGNETLTVVSFTNSNKEDTAYILGDVKVMPEQSEFTATEDTNFTATFWGEGAPEFTWSHSSNCSWLSWNSSSYQISGEPTNLDVGYCLVDISIEDSYQQTDARVFTVNVENVAPDILGKGPKNATEDKEYQHHLKCSDQGTITWFLASNGSWLSFDNATLNLTGTPTNDDVGFVWANVTVDDGNGGLTSRNMTINVTNVNDPPVVEQLEDTTAMEDSLFSLQANANDIDMGDSLTWSMETDASSWLDFDNGTAMMDGTPTNDDIGPYWVNLTAMDREGARDHTNFTITVQNTNDPPEILSTPLINIDAMFTYRYEVVAQDIDVGDVLTYSLDLAPTGMDIDGTEGVVTWTPTEEQGGPHPVKVRVNDGTVDVFQAFDVTVTVLSYYPPQVTLISPENGSKINITNPELSWSWEDPDNTVVYFDVYLHSDLDKVSAKAGPAQVANDITDTVHISGVELEKGQTYYWTVVPWDGEYDGECLDGVWSFTVRQDAVVNSKPIVVLNAPPDNHVVDTQPVQLKWSGADPDDDVISFDVYLSDDLHLVETIDVQAQRADGIEDDTLLVDGLTQGTRYFWTVVPYDGENFGTNPGGIWSFRIAEAVIQNHAPVIDSEPITSVIATQSYQYQVQASDEDAGDVLSYSLVTRPMGMIIDSKMGLILWNPSEAEVGSHEVVVQVSDGSISVEQVFAVEVRPLSELNHPPNLLSTPVIEGKVSEMYEYKVIATDLDVGDTIQYSLVQRPEGMTIDAGTGLITWKPTKDQVGENHVSVQVSDGKDQVEHNFTITVKKADGKVTNAFEDLFPWILLLVLILVVISLVVAASRRRRSKEEGLELESEEESRVTEPGHGEAGSGSGSGPVPALVPVTAREEGVEDFNMNEIFAIYNDGRLLTHSSVQEQEGIDKDLMSGMLVAIQGFVKESFQTQSGLDSFEFGGWKVVLQGGSHIVLACVLEGTEPKVLREEMKKVIETVEGMYAGVIEEWDGRTNYFKDLNQYLLPLFKLKSGMKIKKKKKIVSLRSGVEFYSGFVRLKIGVNNPLDDTIGNISLVLDYDHSTLKLSHIEPEYPISESTIYLPDVHSKEKRTVAVYFDPIICQESHIDGWVTYINSVGDQGEAKMKRRPVDIVCPIFYTPETVNVAMLKRLLTELSYEDSKIFMAEDEKVLKDAHKLAVNVVKAHDVKFVRQYKNDDGPYEAETWFYGEVQETDERIIIKVSSSSALEFLEIFVSSSNLASMTGLLAELGNEFAKKLEMSDIPEGAVTSQTEDEVKEVVRQTKLLLDKYSESEAKAEDIEQE